MRRPNPFNTFNSISLPPSLAPSLPLCISLPSLTLLTSLNAELNYFLCQEEIRFYYFLLQKNARGSEGKWRRDYLPAIKREEKGRGNERNITI